MNIKPKFQQVVEVLIKQGYTDEQIVKFCTALEEQAFAQFYAQALEFFTKEDLAAIEKCESEEKKNEEIARLYKLRTGKDPAEDMEEYINVFSQAFLDEFLKQQQSKPS